MPTKTKSGKQAVGKAAAALVPLAILIWPLTILFSSWTIATAAETDTVKARLVSLYLQEDAAEAQKHGASQKADGTWPDIDYASNARSNWSPMNHLVRLRIMSTAYNQAGHPAYRSADLLAGINRGLDAWYSRRPTSLNWWANQIGSQNELAPILTTMQPHLTPQRVQTGAGFFEYRDGWTGQNLVWFASQLIFKGCLLGNPADVQRGAELIAGEIRTTTAEGIQPDFSFHQHGAQFYSGNYGFSFPIFVFPLANALHGLSFGFSPPKEEILIRYLLEGMQWMTRRGTLASGVRAFLDHTEGRNDSALTGDKFFWRSDFLAHRRPAWLATLRMCSRGLFGGESINSENLKGSHLPFGSLYFQMRGDEYNQIFPVWDWARVPGVTAPHRPVSLSGRVNGTTDFVGGVSDGRYGAAAMDLEMDGVTGRKSWFFFDQEVAALGSDIRSSGPDSVSTSIDQVGLRGEAWSGTWEASLQGRSRPRKSQWTNGLFLYPEMGNYPQGRINIVLFPRKYRHLLR